jgi:formylglycine-generating enzyme required for sulfatase activity
MPDDTARAPYLSDYWTEIDHLEFSDYRAALGQILRHAQTPVTVGVFGPWGSGKTSLLRMLKRDLDNSVLTGLRTVWFTAWKYDRHDALWRAFILRVLDALHPRESGEGPPEKRPRLINPTNPKQIREIDLLNKLEESVYRPVDWQELGRWTANWGQLLKEGGKASAEIAAAFIPGGPALRKVFKLLGTNKEADEEVANAVAAVRREIHAYHREQLESMEQFETTFCEALELILGAHGRLVIFVDDLDRCLPEKALEVLEAIKLFLEVPGTVFVVGMDREVIERGLEHRYESFFLRAGEERSELPIRGDVYLQKIVQVPFHLPPLAVAEVDGFIEAVEKDLPAGSHLDPLTRQVFAHGLFPNPRQVKRALNIFHLLRAIADERIARGALARDSVALPLLAKTVMIQTQYPELYREWRLRPTFVQTLEDEYRRRPMTEEEIVRGLRRVAAAAEEEPTREVAPGVRPEGGSPGGLLAPYFTNRSRYALLERLLAFPPETAAGGGPRARFAGLTREQMAVYVRLAGAAQADSRTVVVPDTLLSPEGEGLLAALLSEDVARQREAIAQVSERDDPEGMQLQQALRPTLLRILRGETEPALRRVAAGNALAELGDPRFDPELWYLPDGPLLGFVEVTGGSFLMGSDKEQDPHARDEETPQHPIELPTYWLARWPVTVAQWRAFVEASGHEPADRDSLQGVATHPAIWMAWHDAIAYCGWLQERLQARAAEEVRRDLPEPERIFWEGLAGGTLRVVLPSEAEWEKGARGTDGRLYPWGDDPDPQRANYGETGLGTTSPLGAFVGGMSPYGIEELSGNVWEWTRSEWVEDAYPYPSEPEARAEREDVMHHFLPRVLRGGGFFNYAPVVRCAVRYRDPPDYRIRDYGFRVAVSPSL